MWISWKFERNKSFLNFYKIAKIEWFLLLPEINAYEKTHFQAWSVLCKISRFINFSMIRVCAVRVCACILHLQSVKPNGPNVYQSFWQMAKITRYFCNYSSSQFDSLFFNQIQLSTGIFCNLSLLYSTL